MSGAAVLLIEDTPSLQMVYEAALTAAGYAVTCADCGASGISAFRAAVPDVVLLDLMLPDADGLALMDQMLATHPALPVVVITANGSINIAVAAMRAGARDFLVKPFDENRLLQAVSNAIGKPREAPPRASGVMRGANGAGSVGGGDRDPMAAGTFIGSSLPMREVYENIRAVARSMATVFVTGESGTGKELCAVALHEQSNRAAGPFVPLNCAAIPPDLLESEVFGHVRGAFTGAIADKLGAAAAADGGTLFLDEICEMDLALQAKLLRFLQTSTIQPLGSSRARRVDVRIVCATNRDPLAAVAAGRFREDLYYRLHVVPLHLPPLRERGGDVIEIAEAVLPRLSREEGRRLQKLSPEVSERFRSYPWPGNVRQLLNVLRNVAVMNDGEVVTMGMLPRELRLAAEDSMAAVPAQPGAEGAAVRMSGLPAALGELVGRPLAEIERLVIEATLERHGGSVPQAARTLDVSPSTLYRKLEAWSRSDHGEG